MNAPDLIGEVVAYRAWVVDVRWDREAWLQSFNGVQWPTDRWLVAECVHRDCGETPGENCSCGIYAARDRSHLTRMGYNRGEVVVIGEVGLVGKVIPGTQGWRAEKARIRSLEVPHAHWRLMDALRSTYRVPVVLSNTLRGV